MTNVLVYKLHVSNVVLECLNLFKLFQKSQIACMMDMESEGKNQSITITKIIK